MINILEIEHEYETLFHSVDYRKDQVDSNADEKDRFQLTDITHITTKNNKSRKNQSNLPKCKYYSTSTKRNHSDIITFRKSKEFIIF